MLQVIGDTARLSSVLFLLFRIKKCRTTRGISIETQELYFAVFLTRYLEIFVNYTYLSWQNIRKISLLSITFYILLQLHRDNKNRISNDEGPAVSYIAIVFPCLSLSLATVLYESTPFRPSAIEYLFTFSFYLEVVALVPQLSIMFKSPTLPILLDTNTDEGPIEISHISDSTSNNRLVPDNVHIYIYLILIFRTCYLVDWFIQIVDPDCFHDASFILDFFVPCTEREPLNLHHLVIYVCGILQTAIIVACVFFTETITRSSAVARYQAWRQRRA